MTSQMRQAGRFGGWLVLAMAAGVAAASILFAVVVVAMEDTHPSHRAVSATGPVDPPPFVEGGYIKVPLTIVRDTECLAQSTFSLQRRTAYPAPLGLREDMVPVQLLNSTLTGTGQHAILLWLALPPKPLPDGVWSVEAKVENDCGEPGNRSVRHPSAVVLGDVTLGGAS